MELGILIVASITVATIATYYYVTSVINTTNNAEQGTASDIINRLTTTAENFANEISSNEIKSTVFDKGIQDNNTATPRSPKGSLTTESGDYSLPVVNESLIQ